MFQPGKSGNPQGRPVGSRSRFAAIRKTVEPFTDELLDRTLDRALQGDGGAQDTLLQLYAKSLEAAKRPRRAAKQS